VDDDFFPLLSQFQSTNCEETTLTTSRRLTRRETTYFVLSFLGSEEVCFEESGAVISGLRPESVEVPIASTAAERCCDDICDEEDVADFLAGGGGGSGSLHCQKFTS
jgi:hypothetical protein